MVVPCSQVHGIGPIFRLTVTLQNTSPSSSATDLYLAFKCDSNLYDLDKNMIMVCVLSLFLFLPPSLTSTLPPSFPPSLSSLLLSLTSLPSSLLFFLPSFSPSSHPPSLSPQLPMLVPSLSYKFDVKVQCLDDFGRSDSIKVFAIYSTT